MATVHPSRMALVPPNPKDSNKQSTNGGSGHNRGRSPSPGADRRRDRDRPPHRARSRSADSRDRGKDRESGRRRYDERDRDDDRRGRRDDSRDRNAGSAPRRASPAYGEYRKEERRDDTRTPDVQESVPWRKSENIDRGHGGANSFENSNLESRRAQRDALTVDVWPPSPKAPARELSSKRVKSSKRNRRDSSSDADSSEEERRRRKKDKKWAKKEKERREKDVRTEQRGEKRRSRSRDYDSESDRERERRRRRHKRSETPRSRSRTPERSRPERPRPDEDDEWVVKDGPSTAPTIVDKLHATRLNDETMRSGHEDLDMQDAGDDYDDDDDDVGPQPFAKIAKKVDERAYGGALLRGEGSAMAAFLADDTKARIPRRGEIGLTSNQIEAYETVGYVMSGNRHRRMNAVRMRKENQVISAEEKRGILKLQQEERSRREAILREEFGELVQEKLKETGAK